MTEVLDARAYAALRREVEGLLGGERHGRGEAEAQRVRRYWDVGRRLDEVLRPFGKRAGYGDQLLDRLSEDLDIRRRLLYEMLRLHRFFPIVPTSAQLGWSHFRVLLGVRAKRARDFYASQSERHGWSVRQLELHVQQGLFEEVPEGRTTAVFAELPRGRLHTYRTVATRRGLRLDLGFRDRCRPDLVDLEGVEAGQVVRSVRRQGEGGPPFRAMSVDATLEEIYTYTAYADRVVDGDTVEVTLDLGFGVEREETIRLRGIDAPELPLARGLEARDHVARVLGSAPVVVVTTRHPDKYGRYLADLWYHSEWRDGGRIAAKGTLLNRELVERGLAARYRR